jgi:DNA uptake protein ComE-like DNA-binding protein
LVKGDTVLRRWQQLKEKWHPLARRLDADPTYRFQSYEEARLAAELGVTIDVNQATVDDWLRLPGLSIRQAQTLAQLRSVGMQFYCIDDLAAALGISTTQLQPLAKILSFQHYEPIGATSPQPLNLNLASHEQLSQIPGMPGQLAVTIVRDRTLRGPFHTLADLQQRLGLSADQIQFLMYFLRA